MAEHTTTPVPRTPRWVRRLRPAYLLQETIGAVPPLAALGLAGYYQTEIAHDVLHFTYPWAAVPAAAIEGGAAYCAVLYDRHLVAGDSTIALRLGMLGYAVGSSALLAWHAHATGKPWQVSVALALLTLSAIFLWGRRGKWRKRAILREKGLLDAQVVRFSVARWFFAPLETPAALRYAVKHSITEPGAAIEAWRTHRSGRAAKVRPEKASKPARTPAVAPVSPAVPPEPGNRTPRRTPVSPVAEYADDDTAVLAARAEADAAVLASLAVAQAKKGRELTLGEVEAIAGGTRPRAVRLRKRLREMATRTPADGDPADEDDRPRALATR